jgi:hypothetical protein
VSTADLGLPGLGTTASADSVVAPPAPGRLGAPVDPVAAAAYLDALARWRDGRKRELDRLDAAALEAPDAAALTGDLLLSMALWKAVSDRYELIAATWSGGRVAAAERERMSALIWGRLDGTLDPGVVARSSAVPGTSLAVSLPEACRLSDALAGSLRSRLALGGIGIDATERVRQLRATLERIRDQIGLEPVGPSQQSASARQARLAGKVAELTDKAGRGGDVGGLLGPLEIEAATFERDLIVSAAQRREAGALVGRARSLRADLSAREAVLEEIVRRCVAAVDPAPRYAVPDVDALGPVPNTAAALQTYLRRLEQVSKAMTKAQDAYLAALAGKEELSGRLEAYRAKAAGLDVLDDPDLARAYALAREALDRQPTRMVIAEQLVALYSSYLQIAARPPQVRSAGPAPDARSSAAAAPRKEST